MRTFRKLARELVIFMLLGPIVAAPASFAFFEHRSVEVVKAEAAQAVYAINAASLSHYGLAVNDHILVPLTNGEKLFVMDCSQAHPSDAGVLHVIHSEPLPETKPSVRKPPDIDNDAIAKENGAISSESAPILPIPPGSTNGSDCFYFTFPKLDSGKWHDVRPLSVSLGDENQIAIEEEYWQAYAKAKSQHRNEDMTAAAVLGLWGFPAGIMGWLFYRLVRFAVKG